MCWIFVPGVAMGADCFMSSIEVITAREYEFKAVEGRGRGLFLTEDVKAGDTILLEEPAVIAPKQMSPLVGTAEGGMV